MKSAGSACREGPIGRGACRGPRRVLGAAACRRPRVALGPPDFIYLLGFSIGRPVHTTTGARWPAPARRSGHWSTWLTSASPERRSITVSMSTLSPRRPVPAQTRGRPIPLTAAIAPPQIQQWMSRWAERSAPLSSVAAPLLRTAPVEAQMLGSLSNRVVLVASGLADVATLPRYPGAEAL